MGCAQAVDTSEFFAALQRAGLPPVPAEFSVVPTHQSVPRPVLESIDEFIGVFEQVTRRPSWWRGVGVEPPPRADGAPAASCFFSAWDVHLPPGQPESWKLIEFNDNGSGFLFAAIINRLYWERARPQNASAIVPPPDIDDFTAHLLAMIAREARGVAGRGEGGLLLILDDAPSLAAGKFRRELELLQELLRAHGWRPRVGAPAELGGGVEGLRYRGEPVCFVVNRSTDFFWEGEDLVPLRAAWRAGRVYAAPNPFTYATRSDKRLLALLSQPGRDRELGITAAERAVLAAHVPRTWTVTEDTLEEIVARKRELVFKPAHGFAGHGLVASEQVGKARLRRLLRKGERYVAQERVPKRTLASPAVGGATLWVDLRIWAYRGERFLLSGRASRRAERLDLTPPGGWLPTYASA